MKILPITQDAMRHAVDVLRDGGTVAHATETCYGLACDLENEDAVRRLFRIKRRPETQPVSALFASVEQAKAYVEWNERAEELAHEHLPGPLTLILPLQGDAPTVLLPIPDGNRTIGIRISSHPLAQELVEKYGMPLSTTSANIHGGANPYSAEELAAQFTGHEPQPDLILDSGTLPQTPPSKVIDLTGLERILRDS